MTETDVLLKAIYDITLTAKSQKEIQRKVRVMLDEEQAAYVEKSVAQAQAEAGEES